MKNSTINFIKLIACIFVILIHCKFPSYLGNIMRTLGKIAVPFFFMISGFYLSSKDGKISKERTKKKAMHILKILFYSGIFYSIFLVFYNIFLIKDRSIFINIFNLTNICKFFLINSPFCYSHLWFLLALLYCYITTYILNDKMNGKWKKTYIFISLFIFTLFSEVLPKFGINLKIFENTIAIYNIYLLRAFPFFCLGMVMRENGATSIENKYNIILICFGALVSIFERILFTESQFYIGTYLIVFYLFDYALKNPNIEVRFLNYIGEKLSLYIYIIHYAVILIINYIIEKCSLDSIVVMYFRPITVILISIMMSYIIDIVLINIRGGNRNEKN